jgi:hypothetical protein
MLCARAIVHARIHDRPALVGIGLLDATPGELEPVLGRERLRQ